jgi:hypothetical protein
MVMAAQQLAIHVTLAAVGLGLALTTSGTAALIRMDFGTVDAVRIGKGLASIALITSAGLVLSEASSGARSA